MLYENYKVVAVYDYYVDVVENTLADSVIHVNLPSVISRMPVIGDRVTFEMDDVDTYEAVFLNFYKTRPKDLSQHTHYLSTEDEWDSIKEHFPAQSRPKSGGMV